MVRKSYTQSLGWQVFYVFFVGFVIAVVIQEAVVEAGKAAVNAALQAATVVVLAKKTKSSSLR